MSHRILLNSSNFKISKPGYDVTSALTDHELILDGAKQGLGLYLTGQVTIAANTKTVVSFSNPYGAIPFVLIQYNNGSNAVGGGLYETVSTTSYLEDTVPATRVYESTRTYGIGFTSYYSTSNIYIWNIATSTKTFRYIIFFAAQASGTGGTYDVTPDSVNWTDFSGAASSTTPIGGTYQTINGIGGPITLRLRTTDNSTLATNQSVNVIINGSTATSISAGSSSVTFAVDNGDTVAFNYLGSAAMTAKSFTVENLSDSTSTLDTFSITATPANDYTIETNWPSGSTSSNSGGTGYNVNVTYGTIGTINQTVTLCLISDANLASTEIVQIYKNYTLIKTMASGTNVSPSFTVNNGDYVWFTHAIIANSVTRTFSVYNLTTSAVNDTFTSTIIDTYDPGPDYTPFPVDWADIDGESYYGSNIALTNSSKTLTAFNQPITIRLSVSSTVPSGTGVYMYVNGSIQIAIGAGSTYGDFTVYVNDVIYFYVYKNTLGNYSATATVTNLTTSSVMDTFAINVTKYSGEPP